MNNQIFKNIMDQHLRSLQNVNIYKNRTVQKFLIKEVDHVRKTLEAIAKKIENEAHNFIKNSISAVVKDNETKNNQIKSMFSQIKSLKKVVDSLGTRLHETRKENEHLRNSLERYHIYVNDYIEKCKSFYSVNGYLKTNQLLLDTVDDYQKYFNLVD